METVLEVARKAETDFQIELISLSQKIKVADKLLEDGHEAANVLLGVVETGFQISSNQLSLAELINTCKNFALKKLKETHTQLAQKDKKMLVLSKSLSIPR